jgi:hypothetical protein
MGTEVLDCVAGAELECLGHDRSGNLLSHTLTLPRYCIQLVICSFEGHALNASWTT